MGYDNIMITLVIFWLYFVNKATAVDLKSAVGLESTVDLESGVYCKYCRPNWGVDPESIVDLASGNQPRTIMYNHGQVHVSAMVKFKSYAYNRESLIQQAIVGFGDRMRIPITTKPGDQIKKLIEVA